MQHVFNTSAKINLSSVAGLTLLLNAIRSDNLAAVDKLINEDKVDVNFCREDGITPLHFAADLGRDRALDMLLAAGANVHVQDSQGHSVLRHAMGDKKYRCVKKLLEAGADPYNVSLVPESRRMMTDAKYSGTFGMEITYPIRAAAERFAVNQAANDGNTAWLQTLLRSEAPPDTLDRYGKSALIWCCAAENLCGIDSLLAAKANPNFAMKDGNTPLHILAQKSDEALIQKICDAGANLKAINKAGQTPLDIALAAGNRAASNFIRARLTAQANDLAQNATKLAKPIVVRRKINIVKRTPAQGGRKP